jgi:hypothetical protein
MSDKKQKKSYFRPEEFIERVFKATGMDKAPLLMQEELKLELIQTLMTTISNTILNAFEDKELFMLQKMLEDHPEIEQIDAITIIAASIPGLEQRLGEVVEDLYEELVQDYKDIEAAIKPQK